MPTGTAPPSVDVVVESQHFPGEDFRDGRAPRPNDVFIAVMGVTGAGKSTFISQLAQRPIKIGYSLQACTQFVEVYACRFNSSMTVYLIDTPGFDDTNRSDTTVLKEIATWLTDSYSHEIKLSGIIYLHRISDPRMPGSAKRNLLMFKKLCGPNALKNVILATTMWDRVAPQEGADRESELRSNEDFWGWMISKGSRVERHDNNGESAMRLIGTFVDQGSKITLELQHQMVNESKTLDQTDAGIELQSEIAKEREKFSEQLKEAREQMEEAIKLKDAESARDIEDLQRKYEESLRRLETDREELKISMEKLHEEKYAELTKRMQAQEDDYTKKILLVEESQEQSKKEHQALLVEFKKLQVTQNDQPPKTPVQRKPTITTVKNVLFPPPEQKTKSVWKVVVALSSQQYYLAGPGGSDKAILSMPVAFKDHQVRRPICVALGTSGAWVASYYDKDNSPYLSSQGLDEYYPKLLDVLLNRNNELGVLEYIALGCNGQYYARFEKGRHWFLVDDILEEEEIEKNSHLIEHLALGAHDTYVISRTDGYRNCKLKGCYRSLGQRLNQLADGEGVKAIALDCCSTDRYILVSTSNVLRMAANDTLIKLVKAWGNSNFGVKW